MKPLNLCGLMFSTELSSEIFKALREYRTVLALEYREPGEQSAALRMELRITHSESLRLPASRTPLTKSEFQERVVDLNARSFLKKSSDQRVRPGRQAARDGASSKRKSQR